MTLGSRFDKAFKMKKKEGSFVDILKFYAETQPEKEAYSFLKDGEGVHQSITYRELDLSARSIAATLQASGIVDRAMLVYPPGIDFIKAFFGCLYAGVVSVPVYLPSARAESWERLKGIMKDADVEAILIDSSCLESVNKWLIDKYASQSVSVMCTENLGVNASKNWKESLVDTNKLAFLQYTSGSTGNPKGVMVSHGNLLHNQSLIESRFCHTNESIVVGWLPQYHDMGLIGNILHPAYIGSTSILMSPVSFIQNPVRWLKAISKYKATTSGGPNFAFDLCVQRVKEDDKKYLDLTSWDLAFNGAEPINPATLEKFYQAFKVCGFKKQAFFPCYGLAESTLIVSGVEKGTPPVVLHVDRNEIENHKIVTKMHADASTLSLISCGRTELGMEIQIVNPQTQQAIHDCAVGEIWLSGGSVAQGYWNSEELTKSAFNSQLDDKPELFLRTGDLGFMHQGSLYVSGRLKDLIILRGKNFYPQDLETIAQDVSLALKPGRGVAFLNDVAGNEQASVVLIQEIERMSLRTADIAQLEIDIKQALFNIFDLNVTVLLVKPGVIPVTSSGKVRRSLCKLNYNQRLYTAVNNTEKAAITVKTEELVPTTPIENFIFNWLKSLCVIAVDLNKSLLDYGIDSIKAAQLQYSIRTEIAIIYPIEKLLANLSIKQLIDDLATYKSCVANSSVEYRSNENSDAEAIEFALSDQQKIFWQIDNKSKCTKALNLSTQISIKSASERPFSFFIFKQAFNALLVQQPILRTVYKEYLGEPKQLIKQASMFSEILTYQDATSLADNELNVLIEQNTHQPFDLKSGPIFRAFIYRLNEQSVLFHFVVHHIAADAWSLQTCIRQISKNYELIAQGKTLHNDAAKLSYSDYCSWQQSFSATSDKNNSELFWQSEFEGFVGLTELPTDRRQPKEFNYVGDNYDIQLSSQSYSGINAFLKCKGVTLYTLLLTVYSVLLHRFMGNKDFVVGTPISLRPAVDFAQVAGCFIDVKPIRIKMNGEMSFDTLLDKVKTTVLSVLDNKNFSSQSILQLSQLTEIISGAEVFPKVRFSLQKSYEFDSIGEFFLATEGAKISLNGLEMSSFEFHNRIAQAELAVTAVETSQKMWLRFNYSSQLFEHDTIVYLAKCYQEILNSVICNSDQGITEIVLPKRNGVSSQPEVSTGSVVPLSAQGVHQLFEKQAARIPNEIAIVCGQKQVTYAELNNRANVLAHEILSRGLEPESKIVIYMHRSIEMVAAFLGGLKARMCCVLLEPSMSRQRCSYILADSQPALVLKNDPSLQLDCAANVAELIVDENVFTDTHKSPNPDLPVSELDAAYVIYTSGSTGEPKGVIGIHRGIINRTDWMIETFGVTNEDVVLHCTPFNFVRAERELFYALAAGARLVLLEHNVLTEPAQFLQALADHKITFTATSPAHIKTLFDYDIELFSSIVPPKNWFIGADVLDHSLISKLHSIHKDMTLSYFYGSTETTSDVSCFIIPKGYQSGAFTTPIGQPLANTKLYILDETLTPVPCGGVGELFVSGHQISRGYLNAQELTEQKYIMNPFSTAIDRLYRTGDLARQLSGGDIVILGRKDSQINLNGFRIDLAEIEHSLYRYNNVKDVAVRFFKETEDKKYIVAYVVLVNNMRPHDEEVALRQHVQAILNDYMQPSVYVFVDKIPRTELGKLNHRLLPDPKQVLNVTLATNYIAPSNELEVMLVEIWQEILELEKIGVEDNFYQLGGNSLLSVKVVTAIEENIGVSITLKEFFSVLTVRKLAEKILTIVIQDIPEISGM